MITSLTDLEHKIPELNEDSHTHECAYDSNMYPVLISEAVRGEKYTDKNRVPLVYKSGQHRTFFSYEATMSKEERKIAMESNTYHDKIIKQIHDSTEPFEFTVALSDGSARTLCLEPAKKVMEKATLKHLGLNFIPDLTFYNDQGEIDCLIEIVVTHKSEESKISQLYNTGILTIEIYYDRENDTHHDLHSIKPICIYGDKWFEKRYKELYFNARESADGYFRDVKHSDGVKRDIEFAKREIERVTRRISEEEGVHADLEKSTDSIRKAIKGIEYRTDTGTERVKEDIRLLQISVDAKGRTLKQLTPLVESKSIQVQEYIRLVKEGTGMEL